MVFSALLSIIPGTLLALITLSSIAVSVALLLYFFGFVVHILGSLWRAGSVPIQDAVGMFTTAFLLVLFGGLAIFLVYGVVISAYKSAKEKKQEVSQ